MRRLPNQATEPPIKLDARSSVNQSSIAPPAGAFDSQIEAIAQQSSTEYTMARFFARHTFAGPSNWREADSITADERDPSCIISFDIHSMNTAERRTVRITSLDGTSAANTVGIFGTVAAYDVEITWTPILVPQVLQLRRYKNYTAFASGITRYGILFDPDSDLLLFKSVWEAHEFASLWDMEGLSISEEGILHVGIDIDPMDLFDFNATNAFIALIARYRTVKTFQVRVKNKAAEPAVLADGKEVFTKKLDEVTKNTSSIILTEGICKGEGYGREIGWSCPAFEIKFREN